MLDFPTTVRRKPAGMASITLDPRTRLASTSATHASGPRASVPFPDRSRDTLGAHGRFAFRIRPHRSPGGRKPHGIPPQIPVFGGDGRSRRDALRTHTLAQPSGRPNRRGRLGTPCDRRSRQPGPAGETSASRGTVRKFEKPRFLRRLARDPWHPDCRRCEDAARCPDETGRRIGARIEAHRGKQGQDAA